MDQKPVETIEHKAEERKQAGYDYLHIKCPVCSCEFGVSNPGFVHCRQCGQPMQVTKGS